MRRQWSSYSPVCVEISGLSRESQHLSLRTTEVRIPISLRLATVLLHDANPLTFWKPVTVAWRYSTGIHNRNPGPIVHPSATFTTKPRNAESEALSPEHASPRHSSAKHWTPNCTSRHFRGTSKRAFSHNSAGEEGGAKPRSSFSRLLPLIWRHGGH